MAWSSESILVQAYNFQYSAVPKNKVNYMYVFENDKIKKQTSFKYIPQKSRNEIKGC